VLKQIIYAFLVLVLRSRLKVIDKSFVHLWASKQVELNRTKLIKILQSENPKAQERTLETKVSILESAIDLFCEGGFQNASIRDIAAMAKVKNQVISYHFGSKLDLWRTSLDILWFELIQSSSVMLIDPKNKRHSYHQHIKNIILNNIRNPEAIKMAYHEILLDSPQCAFIQDHIFNFAKIVKMELKAGIDAGIIKDLPLNDLYYIYANAITARFMVGQVNEWISGKENDNEELIDSHANTIITLFFVADA